MAAFIRGGLFGLAASLGVAACALLDAGCVGDDSSTPTDGSTTDATGDASSDGAGGGDADAPADVAVDAGFDPTWLSGLVLWLDPATGVTYDGSSYVSAWNDRSPSQLTAYAPSQAAKPTYIPASGNLTAAIRFNGTSNFLSIDDDPALRFGVGDFLIELVARHTTGPANPPDIYDKATVTDHMAIVGGTAGQLGGFVSAPDPVQSPNGGYDNGLTFLVGLQRVAGVLSLRINGAEVANRSDSPQSNNADVVGGPVDLGAGVNTAGSPGTGTSFMQGDIVEVVAVKGAMTSGDRTSLETYLKTRHSLP
jgi:hypothetical protein